MKSRLFVLLWYFVEKFYACIHFSRVELLFFFDTFMVEEEKI